jgi:hypothetical protein
MPFESFSGTKMDSYSRRLQRALTDFGIDETFEEASKKIYEHYKIEIPISGIRTITYKHANAIKKQQHAELNRCKSVYSPRYAVTLGEGAQYIVAQTDGTMVPIVSTNCTGYKVELMLHTNQTITSGKILVNKINKKVSLHFINDEGKKVSKSLSGIGCKLEFSGELTDNDIRAITVFLDDPKNNVTSKGICSKNTDKRKNRRVRYQEAKVVLAHKPDEVNPIYSASMNGVDETGKRLRWCAMQVGLGKNTFVHGVGDGAPWIVKQFADKFGDIKYSYLIDMYHLKEYLSAASQAISPDSIEQQKWVNSQAAYLKANEVSQVLHNIGKYSDMADLPQAEAMKTCYQYMDNRQGYNAYQVPVDKLITPQNKNILAKIKNQREKAPIAQLDVQARQLSVEGKNLVILHDNNIILGAIQKQQEQWFFLPIRNKTSKIENINIDDQNSISKLFKGYVENYSQLNYKFAIEHELPIGSGRIESSHRFIAQERLKKPGAWWLEENADAMLAIRTHRQNGGWSEYWAKQ